VSDSSIVDYDGLFEKRHRGFMPGRQQAATEVARLLAIARKEIGIREASENSGPRVDEYNAYVGVRKAKWCASFVSFCFGQAGYQEPKTAWSPALFPTGKLAKEAMPGLVIGIYFDQLKRIGHCGIVERMQGDFVVSIEGNTNVSGSREGDGVYRKLRHRRTIAQYADWITMPHEIASIPRNDERR